MDGRDLTVQVTTEDRVCVLAVRGELDLPTVREFLSLAAQTVADTVQAGSGQVERLVLDLAG